MIRAAIGLDVTKKHRRLPRDADQIQGRVNQARAEIEKSDSDYDREKLQVTCASTLPVATAVPADSPVRAGAIL